MSTDADFLLARTERGYVEPDVEASAVYVHRPTRLGALTDHLILGEQLTRSHPLHRSTPSKRRVSSATTRRKRLEIHAKELEMHGISISPLSIPSSFMPTMGGIALPDPAAWTEEITRLEGLFMSPRLEGLFMSPRIEQHWKSLLLREIATCIFLRHDGKCRDDIDISVALFEVTLDGGSLSLRKWSIRHHYHFCIVLRRSFEDIGKGEGLPNGLELRRLEDTHSKSNPSFSTPIALTIATQLAYYMHLNFPHKADYLDESIALLRAAYTSSYTIGPETKLAALKQLVAALLLRFKKSSCAQDATDALEYGFMVFDVAPDSTDLLPVLVLCFRVLNLDSSTDITALNHDAMLCQTVSQRRRLHAVPHHTIHVHWMYVLMKHFQVTGQPANLDAFRLSVGRTVSSEELPGSVKAKQLLNLGLLLLATGATLGITEQIHEATSHLHAALNIPESPAEVRNYAIKNLCYINSMRFKYSHHPSDYRQAACSFRELVKHIDLGDAEPGATSDLATPFEIAEIAAADAAGAQSIAPPALVIGQLNLIVDNVHGLGARCSSHFQQAHYLRCAAICHLKRLQVRRSLMLTDWEKSAAVAAIEDFTTVLSLTRKLLALVTHPTADGDLNSLQSNLNMFYYGVTIFCEALDTKFEYAESVLPTKLEDIDEAIALLSSPQYDPTILNLDSLLRLCHSRDLINLLRLRNYYARDYKVTEEIIRRTTSLLADPCLTRRSYLWMETAEARAMAMCIMAHPATLQAFQEILESSEDVLHLGPTLEAQFTSLEKISGFSTLAVAHAINVGQRGAAVELIEQGRGLLWKQMRLFRTSVDALINSAEVRLRTLGEAFRATSLELETLMVSTIPEQYALPAPHDDASSLSSKIDEKIKIEARLVDIVDEIRNFPGFEGFMRSPPFAILQQAASEGPVVVVSCNKLRSYALIVLSDRDPICIDLNHTTFNRLCGNSEERSPSTDQLLIARLESGPESHAYDIALKGVLETAASLIVAPVVENLERLGFKPGLQQRIWWCPLGVACTIPLHAAGPFAQPHQGKYLPELYVSSYTPSLSALIDARAQSHVPLSTSNIRNRAMLIVGQPSDPSLANVNEELCTILSILPLETTPTFLLDGHASPTSVSNALKNHSWLHIACHGLSSHDVPTKSAFQLSGGQKLTLRDIIQLRLPNAQFAFLSACSTAEFNVRVAGGILRRSTDEVFHLSAAMQFCGFRGVVGTMWTVNDEDGVQVARHFYRELSRKGGEVMQVEDWDPRDAASALNKAVRKLKRKLKGERGSLERWVNFIHVGI